MKTKLTVIAFVIAGLALLSIVINSFSNDPQSNERNEPVIPNSTSSPSDQIESGKVIVRSAIKPGNKYEDDLFTVETSQTFAEGMEKEFNAEFGKRFKQDSTLNSSSAQFVSRGNVIEIRGHKAMIAWVSTGPLANGLAMWSIYLLGNGKEKSISVQCMGFATTQEEILNDECQQEFLSLVGRN